MIEHHIQREILRRLGASRSLRFSSLKPTGMENNSFMYHLRSLQRAGYLQQADDKTYLLTLQGKSYLDSLSYETDRPRRQPKVLAIFALIDTQGRYIFAHRKTEPTRGTWMLPSGKQHFSESPEDHVSREIRDLTGTDLPLRRRGYVDIRIRHDEMVVTHLMGHVYSCGYDGRLPQATEKFDFDRFEPGALPDPTPGTLRVLDALRADAPFFLSLDVQAQ